MSAAARSKCVVKCRGRAVLFKQLNGARVRWEFQSVEKATKFDHSAAAFEAIEDYGLDAERCEVVPVNDQ